jgi:hypothetical protein
MQPEFVVDGLLAWGKPECHACHRRYIPLTCNIDSSYPRLAKDGSAHWMVRLYCPKCAAINGLVLSCPINWEQVKDWVRQLEKSQTKPPRRKDNGVPIPSRRNVAAPQINEDDLVQARRLLAAVDDHTEFMEAIGVRTRDIYPPKKRPRE